ncbi:MAG: hypothetical protein HY054_04495 [Proteobacteria bacterium]|nr:hypothetical protein [Pseudomonadota bacterium]
MNAGSVRHLLSRAALRADAGGDGSALVLLRSALIETDASQHEPIALALRRIEAIAAAGIAEEPCSLDEVLEEPPPLVDATLAAAVTKLCSWAERVWASEERLAYLRRRAATEGGRSPSLALALSASAQSLARNGRFEIAVPLCTEAVSMWCKLIDGGATLLAARLADSLRLLGAVESERGNLEKGVSLGAEARDLFLRELDRNDRIQNRMGLGAALHNLAGAYLKTGDVSRAVAVSNEAIAVRRLLAVQAPMVCGLDMARTLSEASVVFGHAELFDDAFSVSQEATEFFRTASLAEVAYLNPLATALRNLSQHAFAVGQYAVGLDATDEEIAIYRRRGHHEGNDTTTALAGALHNRASHLAMLAQNEEALKSVSEAIDTQRSASGASARRAAMGASMHLAGIVAHQAGREEEALDRLAEAVKVRNTLRVGGDAEAQVDYARSCSELADAQCAAGQWALAVETNEEAVAAMSAVMRLRASKSDVFEYARLLLQTGNLQRRVGRISAAIRSYEAVAALRSQLQEMELDGALADVAAQRLISCLRRSNGASAGSTPHT